jgi:hypothetical protein
MIVHFSIAAVLLMLADDRALFTAAAAAAGRARYNATAIQTILRSDVRFVMLCTRVVARCIHVTAGTIG